MMEWMRLTFVHCAPECTPPHFVVNAMKMIVLCVLTHVFWKVEVTALVLCCVHYRERFGVDSGGSSGLTFL